MPNTTNRFGFTRLTRAVDPISLDDWKFARADRKTLDRLLQLALEEHIHAGFDSPDELVRGVPTVNAHTTGGAIPAATRYFYRYSLVDQFGTETICSQPIAVQTAAPATAPAPPIVAQSTAGNLAGGVYSYAISAYTTDTRDETTLSNPVQVSVSHSSSVDVTITGVPTTVTGFNIYRRGPQDDRYYWVAAHGGDGLFHDSVAAADRTRPAPLKNTSNRSSSVTVSLPFVPPAGYGWKLYRSSDPTQWAGTLVAHQPEPTEIIDTGYATGEGHPIVTSTAVGTPTKIDVENLNEVTGDLPPSRVVSTEEIVFIFPGPVSLDSSPFYWVNEFDHCLLLGSRTHLTG